jgi:hypothetical protein
LTISRATLDKVTLSEGKYNLITFYDRKGMAEQVGAIIEGIKKLQGNG